MPATEETFSNEAVIAWAGENPDQQLDIARAIVQRMLNLRQELSEQEQPDPEELELLKGMIFGIGIRRSVLPYEALVGSDIPPVFTAVTINDEKTWELIARCRDENPDLFFPDRQTSPEKKAAATEKAKAFCGECVVSETCLEYALTHGEKFGIWGGLSERERRKLRRQRMMRPTVSDIASLIRPN